MPRLPNITTTKSDFTMTREQFEEGFAEILKYMDKISYIYALTSPIKITYGGSCYTIYREGNGFFKKCEGGILLEYGAYSSHYLPYEAIKALTAVYHPPED